jgi:hypothetical protein
MKSIKFRIFWGRVVTLKVTTRRYIPEDSKRHTRRRENLKSHMKSIFHERVLLFYSDVFLKIHVLGY